MPSTPTSSMPAPRRLRADAFARFSFKLAGCRSMHAARISWSGWRDDEHARCVQVPVTPAVSVTSPHVNNVVLISQASQSEPRLAAAGSRDALAPAQLARTGACAGYDPQMTSATNRIFDAADELARGAWLGRVGIEKGPEHASNVSSPCLTNPCRRGQVSVAFDTSTVAHQPILGATTKLQLRSNTQRRHFSMETTCRPKRRTRSPSPPQPSRA